MSYIFSRALVEAYLEASCSDSAPFALSNLNPIPQAYCSPDRMTAYSRLSRFGMTYAPLTDDRGAALLTWYLEASRARTFQPQEKAPALTAPAPASGGKCTELSMRYDRNSHSWKTHLCLWDEDLPESSVILPKSGTMRNGLCWERTMWEPRTSESASGYLVWIGMPTASGKKRSEKFRVGNKLPNPYEFVEMFPSPLASDYKRRGPKSSQQGLPEFVRMFPTPTSSCGGKESNRKTGKKLITVVSQFPTPRTKGMCGGDGEFSENERPGSQGNYHAGRAETNDCGEWWSAEPGVGRVAHGVAARVDRIKALGNGQVPAVAATAFRVLLERFTNHNPQLTLF